jgi:hypothetical protein
MRSVIFLLFGLAFAGCCQAQAGRSLAEVSIIDRETGAILPLHHYRGEYWVVGRPGAHYAIDVQSRHGERLLAVTAVDGINVLSGETAAWSQAGYVFDPNEHYAITGWRKSDQQVAAFTFTALPNSYAARTGRPKNVGVIGVALFRERARPQAVLPQPDGETRLYDQAPIAPPAAAAAAPGDAQSQLQSRAQAAQEFGIAPESRIAPQTMLGTGHGPREASFVSHTEFERMRDRPDQIVRIHYDRLENLLAMGIIMRPPYLPPAPNAFPGSADQYVPDPPG